MIKIFLFFIGYTLSIAAGVAVGHETHPLVGVVVIGASILVVYRLIDFAMIRRRRHRAVKIIGIAPNLWRTS